MITWRVKNRNSRMLVFSIMMTIMIFSTTMTFICCINGFIYPTVVIHNDIPTIVQKNNNSDKRIPTTLFVTTSTPHTTNIEDVKQNVHITTTTKKPRKKKKKKTDTNLPNVILDENINILNDNDDNDNNDEDLKQRNFKTLIEELEQRLTDIENEIESISAARAATKAELWAKNEDDNFSDEIHDIEMEYLLEEAKIEKEVYEQEVQADLELQEFLAEFEA